MLDELEQIYAPPDHPVFQLVPTTFRKIATKLYGEIGSPIVDFKSFWPVYEQLLQKFIENGCTRDEELQNELNSVIEDSRRISDDDKLPLIPGLKELRNGDNVVGCQPVDGDRSTTMEFVEPEAADFTDYEDDN